MAPDEPHEDLRPEEETQRQNEEEVEEKEDDAEGSDTEGDESDEEIERRKLPDDLPKSLNDRSYVPRFDQETEMYDAWQGQSQFLTTPVPAKPLSFNLSLDDEADRDPNDGRDGTPGMEDSDTRLMEMMAAQAAHREDGDAGKDEDELAGDETRPMAERREMLQKVLNMAASNGDTERVERLVNGKAKSFVDVNAPDEEGTAPLIYASCFGHGDVVQALIDAGADVDQQDRHQWSALMWAMTNRHKAIAKRLLDHGASSDIKSSSGRTAFDFVPPNSELSDYLNESGYKIGTAGMADDFYNAGFSQDRFEEEMAENEMKRRMMMESAVNLEVDLSSLGLDEAPETPEPDDTPDFIWDRCLNDQMFVFAAEDLPRILEIVITQMTPQRSPTQKPVPANILFLSARYAHYHASADLLADLLGSAMMRINAVVERHQWDMTILAFWISNATLLLHYLKKDGGLVGSTTDFQLQLAELINEIFILIVRDAERRMDKVLDAAMLDHETIPGFENVHFQHEWRIFKRGKPQPQEESDKRFRPPSPKRRAQTSPRNITSLLSSTLFVLDLYDVHAVIAAQCLAQLFYWLAAELSNRIMSNRRYLARTKAMQIRMNVSALEEWARQNDRPHHPENPDNPGSAGETLETAARRHLAPLIQLLQWLQCFSSLGGEDLESLQATLQQLPRLSPQQLISTAKLYRPEVGERGLSKPALKYLAGLQRDIVERSRRRVTTPPPTTPPKNGTPTPATPSHEEQEDTPNHYLLDPATMLPFSLPTSTDMLVSYGAGFGGVNRERARKYLPSVPPEFLAKLDLSQSEGGSGGGGGRESMYEGVDFDD